MATIHLCVCVGVCVCVESSNCQDVAAHQRARKDGTVFSCSIILGLKGPWRNGSASDFRLEGWALTSVWPRVHVSELSLGDFAPAELSDTHTARITPRKSVYVGYPRQRTPPTYLHHLPATHSRCSHIVATRWRRGVLQRKW